MTARATIFILIAALSIGCKKPDSPPTPSTAQSTQTAQRRAVPAHDTKTAAPAPNSDEAEWTKALKAREPELIQQVLARHGIKPGSVDIKVSDDLLVEVSGQEQTCERQVPSGFVEAELITNFDHTLDYCVRKIMEPAP